MFTRLVLVRGLSVVAVISCLAGGWHVAQMVTGMAERSLGNYLLTVFPWVAAIALWPLIRWLKTEKPGPVAEERDVKMASFEPVVQSLDLLHHYFPAASPAQDQLLELAKAAMAQRYNNRQRSATARKSGRAAVR
ncbi:hypothetical protein [Planctopirus hydrillae]|nr:hypothetical protein [Planctopirus hydrillae]